MKPKPSKPVWTMIVLAILILFFSIRIGYFSYLATINNRACLHMSEIISVPESKKTSQDFQRVLDDYSAEHENTGLQVTIIFPDGATWNGVSGKASHEQECTLTQEHHLFIGSMTKLYTAVLVMEQVEKGAVSLNDTLDQWIELPEAEKITIKMLLNHSSGIPSYTSDFWFLARYFGLPKKQWRTDELVEVIHRRVLKFEPGSRHDYSNSNYLLLGVILEKVTGKTYWELLSTFVEGKLGLHDTHFLTYPEDTAIANGYDINLLHLGRRNLTGFRASMESGAFAAGGILSKSSDVAGFVHMLFTGQLLSDASLISMQTFMDAPDDDMPSQQGYGLGLRYLRVDGESLIGHTGTIPGYSGIAMHHKEHHYTIVILSNLSVIEQIELLAEFQKVILGMKIFVNSTGV